MWVHRACSCHRSPTITADSEASIELHISHTCNAHLEGDWRMDSLFINLLLGLVIGLTLGFLGGGGSILTVPALVYVVGQSPHAAVTASLIIVGANAGFGSFFHRNQGTLNWEVALVFGGVGMVTAYLAAGLCAAIPSGILLVLFAVLMLAVGVMMIFRRMPCDEPQVSRGWVVVAATGAGVGALTGLLGVGGGFLIVPALVMLVGLPIQQAIGTSLIIIAMNSAAGVAGHLGASDIDLQVITLFIISGFVGAFLGTRMAKVIPSGKLHLSFAVFIVVLGAALLFDNILKLI